MKLKDKVALVTGAGSGIGQATAVLFAQEGAKVAVVDVREDAAKGTAEQIERAGGHALAIRADVAKAADIQAAVNQTLARWGRLDVFYANAGVPQRPTSVEEVDEATFDQIMAVNVKGVFLGAKYAAPVFKRQRSGVLLITGSTSAIRPRPGVQCYSASKGAVHTLAKSLALELGGHGITVNAISPGAIITERTLADDPHMEQNWATVTPNGRAGQVDDVVAAAQFLASPQASHITWQTLMVDGGWTLHSPLPAEHPEPTRRA